MLLLLGLLYFFTPVHHLKELQASKWIWKVYIPHSVHYFLPTVHIYRYMHFATGICIKGSHNNWLCRDSEISPFWKCKTQILDHTSTTIAIKRFILVDICSGLLKKSYALSNVEGIFSVCLADGREWNFSFKCKGHITIVNTWEW